MVPASGEWRLPSNWGATFTSLHRPQYARPETNRRWPHMPALKRNEFRAPGHPTSGARQAFGMRIGGAVVTLPLPPKPDRRFSRIRLSGRWLPMGWLRHSTQGVQKSRTSRADFRPAHLGLRRPTVRFHFVSQPGIPGHPREQPCGTTRTLVRGIRHDPQHHVPTSLGSTVVTRFFATTDALTPTGPFIATSRGSLIHVTQTADHSVSNHLRSSARRVPLPQRWPHYFVRASPLRSQARQNRRPNRVHFVLRSRRTMLRTDRSLPVALHPGISPRCSYFPFLALQCRPGQGLSPCCPSALSGARARNLFRFNTRRTSENRNGLKCALLRSVSEAFLHASETKRNEKDAKRCE